MIPLHLAVYFLPRAKAKTQLVKKTVLTLPSPGSPRPSSTPLCSPWTKSSPVGKKSAIRHPSGKISPNCWFITSPIWSIRNQTWRKSKNTLPPTSPNILGSKSKMSEPFTTKGNLQSWFDFPTRKAVLLLTTTSTRGKEIVKILWACKVRFQGWFRIAWRRLKSRSGWQ